MSTDGWRDSNGGRKVNEYTEKLTVLQDASFVSRPVVESQYDAVFKVANARRRMSGVALAALVVAAMTVVVITILITNRQQRNRDQELVRDQARIAAAQQTAAQSVLQQPVIVSTPPSHPAVVSGPSRSQPRIFESGIATTNAGLEIEVTSRLQSDEKLRRYAVFVKVTHGSAVLSGQVSDENLKARAEKLARAVAGIRTVINEIAVTPEFREE
jgi:osmotically-inducible protein OsmY